MSKQLELGTQMPMKPATCSCVITSEFTVINSGASPDWTDESQVMPISFGHAHMVDYLRFKTSGNYIATREGQFMMTLYLYIRNDTGGNEDVQVAITDAAGTTVHYNSPDITVPAGSTYFHRACALIHIPTMGFTEIAVQIAQTTGAGNDLRVEAVAAGPPGVRGTVLLLHKVGNANES